MVGEGLIVPTLFQISISPWKRGSEGPKYCEVTAYDFMTFYDFTAYKCTAHDFRPDDFTTYVLQPVENVSVSPIFFPNSIKGWTLFIIWWTLSIIWWTLSIIWCTPTHYMMDPCPSYDGPQTVPNQKVMNNSAIQWRIKKIISQHSLNSNSLIHRLLKTRDIANLSKKGIHHIMYPIHHMMYPYPAYDVPLSIIWCTPIHHMMYPYPSYVAPRPSYDGGVEKHIL